MVRRAMEQASCTECGEQEDNFSLTNRDMEIEEGEIQYSVECDCGERGTITVNTEGTHGSENISFEDASWNQEDDDE